MPRQKREKSGTGICHVMKRKESKTCPYDSPGLSNATKTKHNLTNTNGKIDAYVVTGEILSCIQGTVGLKPEGNIHSISVPVYINTIVKTTPIKTDDIVLALWKHTNGCVKYILNK